MNKNLQVAIIILSASLFNCQKKIEEAEAKQIAFKLLQSYCQAEGYNLKKMKPKPSYKSCRCVDERCKQTVECEEGDSVQYNRDESLWEFYYEYTGMPPHEFNILVDDYGRAEYSGDVLPKKFGRK